MYVVGQVAHLQRVVNPLGGCTTRPGSAVNNHAQVGNLPYKATHRKPGNCGGKEPL